MVFLTWTAELFKSHELLIFPMFQVGVICDISPIQVSVSLTLSLQAHSIALSQSPGGLEGARSLQLGSGLTLPLQSLITMVSDCIH